MTLRGPRTLIHSGNPVVGLLYFMEAEVKSVLKACGIVLAATPMLLAASPAVPEPASIVLIGTGIAGLGFAVWRRNRAKK